jgi:hypothetical protein
MKKIDVNVPNSKFQIPVFLILEVVSCISKKSRESTQQKAKSMRRVAMENQTDFNPKQKQKCNIR